MAKLTLIMQRQARSEGRIGLDGTRVYVQHPDDPMKIVEMPHESEEAARAAIATVIKRSFDARLGWKVWRELDTIDVASWRPKPTRKPPPRAPEEIAAEEAAKLAAQAENAAAARCRQLGWRVDGEVMVLSLKRQASDGDLEIALVDNARDVTALHVLVSVFDDEDGIGRAKLFARLASDGVPALEVLTLESPWESAYDLARMQMPGLSSMLEKRRLRELAVIGKFALPSSGAMQSLERLRLHTESLSATDYARIGDARRLRVLELIAGEGLRDGIPQLPLGQLDELALEWVGDVAMTLEALLDARRDRLPPVVHVQGGDAGPTTALHAAVERWRREAPTSTLTFGAFRRPPDGGLEALGIAQRVSTFSPEARAPTLRTLWAPLY